MSRTRGASEERLNEDLAAVVVEAGVVFAQNFRSSLCRRDRYIRILRARQIVLEWATKGGCWLSRIERSRPPSREDTKKRTHKLFSLPFSRPLSSISLSPPPFFSQFLLSSPLGHLRRRPISFARSFASPFLETSSWKAEIRRRRLPRVHGKKDQRWRS